MRYEQHRAKNGYRKADNKQHPARMVVVVHAKIPCENLDWPRLDAWHARIWNFSVDEPALFRMIARFTPKPPQFFARE